MKRLLERRSGLTQVVYCGACFALCLTWLAHAAAQEPSGLAQEKSCLSFVKGFYDWYVPLSKKSMNEPTFNVALQKKTDVFNLDLLQALRADSEAAAHAKGDIVGIDFDPFLGGQDPAAHYEARHASWRNNKCSVEIWPVSPKTTSAKAGKPDVIVDLAFDGGYWKFVNFRYPDSNTDLLGVLKTLKQERQKQ